MDSPEEVIDLLADEYARAILAETDTEPMSAQDLAHALDAHHSTIYRRIEQLQRFDLLRGHGNLDRDGHHFTTYENRLDRVGIELTDGRYAVNLYLDEDPTERIATMWREIRGEGQ